MLPLLGGLLSGGASLLGSFFSSNTSAQNTQAQIQAQQGAQKEAEEFNAGQAQISRDYQTQMSNTAYQRSSADMKAAGLNPALMFSSGSAASTPSSPTPQISPQQIPVSQARGGFAGIGDAVNKAVSSAIDIKTFDKMSEEIANLRTAGRLGEAQIRTEAQRPEQVAASTSLQQIEEKLRRLDIPASTFSARTAQDLLNMPEALRSNLNIGSWVGKKGEDIAAPIVNTATRLGGLEILKNALGKRNSASAFRRGWDAADEAGGLRGN